MPGLYHCGWQVGGTQNKSLEFGPIWTRWCVTFTKSANPSDRAVTSSASIRLCSSCEEKHIKLGPLRDNCCVIGSHSRTVLSFDPETMCLPSGENATDLTQPSCPSNTSSSCPVLASSVVPGFGMCHYVMLYTLVPPYHGSLGS